MTESSTESTTASIPLRSQGTTDQTQSDHREPCAAVAWVRYNYRLSCHVPAGRATSKAVFTIFTHRNSCTSRRTMSSHDDSPHSTVLLNTADHQVFWRNPDSVLPCIAERGSLLAHLMYTKVNSATLGRNEDSSPIENIDDLDAVSDRFFAEGGPIKLGPDLSSPMLFTTSISMVSLEDTPVLFKIDLDVLEPVTELAREKRYKDLASPTGPATDMKVKRFSLERLKRLREKVKKLFVRHSTEPCSFAEQSSQHDPVLINYQKQRALLERKAPKLLTTTQNDPLV